MAIKKRLLATAAIPFLAIAGASLPAAAAVMRPSVAIEAPSPIITVQSEEEVLPKKRKREARREASDPSNAEGAEEPARKKRKERQQAESNQNDDAVSDEDIVNQGKKRKQRQQAEERMDQAQPSDSAEIGRPAGAEEAQGRPAGRSDRNGDAVSDEDIVNQGKKRKQRQQAEERMDQAQPSDSAESADQPARKKRKDAQQAESDRNDNAVSDEDIVNQGKKRRKRQQAEAETPAVIEKREEIAKDPAKTTDTVVLPVENGAAVLDSDKDADNSGANRERRKRQREDAKDMRVPKSDKDAQKTDVKVVIKPVIELKGERVDDFRGYRRPEGRVIGKGDDMRVVFDLDGKVVIRSDDRDRIGRNEPIRYERLGDGRVKEIVVRPNGDRIVTVRNRWGEIIRRSRIDNRQREVVIFYSPELDRGRDRLFMRDPGDALPPMRLRVPVDDYIIDVSSNRNRDYRSFLAKPPVETVERVYSVDEVKYSARIRDKVRRIDLDTITFETGSAEISRDQASTLRQVASAINDLLDRDPGETFLIEGHTDAVGSDKSNLVLSDERANSVASVLSELFDIPAENLVTQGYGERYLKVNTEGAERANRRVTIRRITPLVRPANVSEN